MKKIVFCIIAPSNPEIKTTIKIYTVCIKIYTFFNPLKKSQKLFQTVYQLNKKIFKSDFGFLLRLARNLYIENLLQKCNTSLVTASYEAESNPESGNIIWIASGYRLRNDVLRKRISKLTDNGIITIIRNCGGDSLKQA